MRHTTLKTLVPVAALAALLYACKNDLKVLAPYKESVSVYGLINPNQDTQKLRINKIFLGEGDANVMAQKTDSVNFQPNEITVILERYMDGSTTPTLTTMGNGTRKSITLTEMVVTTSPGAFSSTQRLYITTDKLYPSGNYKLTITKNSSGKQFTALSEAIDSVKPGGIKPFVLGTTQPAHPFPVGTPQSSYIDYSTPGIQQKIKFKSIPNARLYNVVMRFHYHDSLTNNTIVNRYADYNFVTQKSTTLDGSEDLEVDFMSDDFYTNVAAIINTAPPVANLKNRASDYIEYIIYAGSQDLSDFLQVNAPSNSIAQDKPYYTNVSGGVGIFACRSKSALGKDISVNFIDAISVNHSTCPLRFCNSAGTWSFNNCQ